MLRFSGEDYDNFLKKIGLRTPGGHSYLYEITDQRLWMLAKIKYGF